MMMISPNKRMGGFDYLLIARHAEVSAKAGYWLMVIGFRKQDCNP
jgi:hypothetical protein